MLLLASIFLFASCGDESFSLHVAAWGEDGVTLQSENLVNVPYGGTAEFTFDIAEEGKSIVQVIADGVPTENYSVENNVLKVFDITSPCSLRLVAGDVEKRVTFATEPNVAGGGLPSTSMAQGKITSGSYVTFSAKPKTGSVFLGWSLQKPLTGGGELLSTEEQFTMKIEQNTFLYANYDVSAIVKPEEEEPVSDQYDVLVFYNANGGVTKTGRPAVEMGVDTSYWKMGVGREDDGMFVRDGYILLGYCASPDGNGELILPGHRYLLPENEKTMTLYCIWQEASPVSDFVFKDVGSVGVAIEKYTGTAAEVYIPRSVNGKDVLQIWDGSFKGTNVEKVVIPPTVESVSSDAFTDCKKLTSVRVYDNLRTVSDDSFKGSPVKHLQLCAATTPRYIYSNQSQTKKYERVMMTEGKPRIFVVAGSSKLYGLDSPYLEELMGDKYTVVNLGTNANMSVLAFLEFATAHLQKDDILVYAPEQYNTHAYWSTGSREFPAITFQGIEGCYNILEEIDLSEYTGVFDSLSQHNKGRLSLKERSWNDNAARFNDYGEIVAVRRTLNRESYNNKSNGTFRFLPERFPVELVDNLNRVLDMAAEKGAHVFFSHPSYNKNACDPATMTDAHFDAYHEHIRQYIHATLISDVRLSIFEGKYFDNSDYHLNGIGREMHTKQLAEDIKAQGIQ